MSAAGWVVFLAGVLAVLTVLVACGRYAWRLYWGEACRDGAQEPAPPVGVVLGALAFLCSVLYVVSLVEAL